TLSFGLPALANHSRWACLNFKQTLRAATMASETPVRPVKSARLPSARKTTALDAFSDPCWRLTNLYAIRTRDGSIIRFQPRPQQQQIIDLIYRRDCRRIIILKARQLGMSTLLGVVCADRLCFGMGQQVSLVDQTIED